MANDYKRGLILAVFFEGGNVIADFTKDADRHASTDSGTVKLTGYEVTDGEAITFPQNGMHTGEGTTLWTFQSNVSTPTQTRARPGWNIDTNNSINRITDDSTVQVDLNGSPQNLILPNDIWDFTERNYACRWNNSGLDGGSNEREMRQDRAWVSSTTDIGGDVALTTDIVLMNRVAGDRSGEGIMRYFLLWDRALSRIDIANLQENPYQIFEPLNTWLYTSDQISEVVEPDAPIQTPGTRHIRKQIGIFYG